jgi:hypothetical protein
MSRLCQGCSRPPRHHAAQAALSYSDLLRQATGEGLPPPLESQRLMAHRRHLTEPVRRGGLAEAVDEHQDGHANIAAANRRHARDPQRTLKLLQAA